MTPWLQRCSILIAMSLGCGTQAAPIELPAPWPEKAGEYVSVTDAWTRSGHVLANLDRVIEAHAIYKSAPWRAASAARQRAAQKLTDSEYTQLVETHKTTLNKQIEFALLVATFEYDENDFTRGTRSNWQVRLLTQDGRAIAPKKIRLDRRPREVIRKDFRHFSDFSRAYIVEFPRDTAASIEQGGSFSLRITGTRGTVLMTWRNDD